MKRLLFILGIISLISVSCSKERSKKWMVIDLSIVSTLTGEPINSWLTLEYRQGSALPLGEDQLETIDLGGTTDGKFYGEISVSKRAYNYVLKIKKGGWYSGGPYNYDSEHQLSVTKNNVLELEWTPVAYSWSAKLKNTSCYDETDSLWISYRYNETDFSDEILYTGCVDSEYFQNGWSNSFWPQTNQMVLKLRSKKNGVEEFFEVTETLLPEHQNEFLIEY